MALGWDPDQKDAARQVYDGEGKKEEDKKEVGEGGERIGRARMMGRCDAQLL